MESMSTCYRYLQYKSLNLRIPAAGKPSLNFGSAIHLALEHRYRKYGTGYVDDQFYNEVAAMFTEFFAKNEAPEGDWRTLNWAMTLLRRYVERYDLETFNLLSDKEGKPMVELSFALPLFTWKGMAEHPEAGWVDWEVPIIYTGRIDLPIQIDDQIFVMDHKTTSTFVFGPSMSFKSFFDAMKMSAQQKGYCWAFRELTGVKPAGYMVNAIRTAEPPQYVLTGKESSRTNREGIKATPEKWWNDSFQRERFILEDKELDEWRDNTIALVEEFFYNYSKGIMPMKTAWCTAYGRCPYLDVCSLPSDTRDVMLSSDLFTDNTWTPLNKPTQSKQ